MGKTLVCHTHHQISLRPSSKSNSDEHWNRGGTWSLNEQNSKSSITSANFVAENGDLLTQILVRLPVKPLIRFQSVSKKWLLIISDPAFRRRCFPRRTGAHFLWRGAIDMELNSLSLDESYLSTMSSTVLQLSNLFDLNRVVGFNSCNGLLAIVLKNSDGGLNFVVYNPTTLHSRLIPPIPGTGGEDSFWGFIDSDSETEDSMSPMIRPQTYRYFGALHIAFDPSQSDHYKLLYICGFWNLRFASYASDTQLWSKSRSVLDHQLWNNMTMYYKKGVFWNGDMFWVDSRLGTYCFNFEKGCAKRITASLPQGRPILEVDRHPDVIYFGVCGDSLSLVRLMDFHPLLLDIYQLELDYSRWNFKYQVDLSPLRSAPYSSMFDIAPHSAWWQRFYVLNCLMDEQLKPTELLISVRGKIISYDIQDMIVKEIADVVPDTDEAHWRFLFKWSQVFEHFETVASV